MKRLHDIPRERTNYTQYEQSIELARFDIVAFERIREQFEDYYQMFEDYYQMTARAQERLTMLNDTFAREQ